MGLPHRKILHDDRAGGHQTELHNGPDGSFESRKTETGEAAEVARNDGRREGGGNPGDSDAPEWCDRREVGDHESRLRADLNARRTLTAEVLTSRSEKRNGPSQIRAIDATVRIGGQRRRAFDPRRATDRPIGFQVGGRRSSPASSRPREKRRSQGEGQKAPGGGCGKSATGTRSGKHEGVCCERNIAESGLRVAQALHEPSFLRFGNCCRNARRGPHLGGDGCPADRRPVRLVRWVGRCAPFPGAVGEEMGLLLRHPSGYARSLLRRSRAQHRKNRPEERAALPRGIRHEGYGITSVSRARRAAHGHFDRLVGQVDLDGRRAEGPAPHAGRRRRGDSSTRLGRLNGFEDQPVRDEFLRGVGRTSLDPSRRSRPTGSSGQTS